MKPSIGRKVYCIYEDSILAEPVYAVGKDTFFLDPCCKNNDAIEWSYNSYNETWFTNLVKAKKKLINIYKECYNEKLTVVKLDEDYYELR